MERERRSLAVVTVSVVFLLAAGVGGTGAQSAGTAGLDESVVRVAQGETATLTVTLSNTSTATLVLTAEGGYNITITVTDGNGDGTVPLAFETDPIGTMRTRFVPVDDGDDYATPNAAPDADSNVSVGEYSIDVYAGHGVSGSPADVGTLVVTEASGPPEASIEGAPLTLHPAAGQVVTGTVDLDARRTVTVRLRSGGETPFLRSDEATVGEDGSFRATVNLTGVDAPATATVTVLADGARVAEADAEVVAAATTAPDGQPGFGVGVALAGLLWAALVGRRLRG